MREECRGGGGGTCSLWIVGVRVEGGGSGEGR